MKPYATKNLYISNENKEFYQTLDLYRVLLENQLKIKIRSESEILFRLAKLGSKQLDAQQGRPTMNKSRTKDSSSISNNIKEETSLKTFAAINEYRYKKINGKHISDAYKDGDISYEDTIDIIVSATMIHENVSHDRDMGPRFNTIAAPKMNCKNATKSKFRQEVFSNKVGEAIRPFAPKPKSDRIKTPVIPFIEIDGLFCNANDWEEID